MFDGSDPFWAESREYSRAEAWIDLIQMAAYARHQKITGFAVETIERGEFVASVRFLGARWGWDKMRVSRFIALLEKMGRVARQRDGQHGAVYLLVNYDTYQIGETPTETASETPSETPARHARDSRETNKKEGEGRRMKEKGGGAPTSGAARLPSRKAAATAAPTPEALESAPLASGEVPWHTHEEAWAYHWERIIGGVAPITAIRQALRYGKGGGAKWDTLTGDAQALAVRMVPHFLTAKREATWAMKDLPTYYAGMAGWERVAEAQEQRTREAAARDAAAREAAQAEIDAYNDSLITLDEETDDVR